jgi:hypothetical protein
VTRNTGAAQLARWQILTLVASGSLLWLSGGLWILLEYFGQVEGDFGPEPSPLQPWLLRLHGLTMIPALLGFGGLFVVHVPKGWRSKRQRNTGIALLCINSVLIFSGYLLYYVGSDALRPWTSITHWGLGVWLPVLFIWHYLHGRRKRRSPRASP